MKHLITKVPSKLTTIIAAFDAGSRLESIGGYNDGISHMLEHCIFKGTDKRTWQDINREIGFMGGDVNAFTSHDIVAYHITVPYENTKDASDVLSDIVLNSIIPDDEFLKEVEVVKEEEMSKFDDISSFLWNSYSDKFFNNYISRPVIGTQDTISRFSSDEVRSFYSSFCNRKRAVVSIAGSLGKRDMKSILNESFGASDRAKVRNYDGDL